MFGLDDALCYENAIKDGRLVLVFVLLERDFCAVVVRCEPDVPLSSQLTDGAFGLVVFMLAALTGTKHHFGELIRFYLVPTQEVDFGLGLVWFFLELY